MFSYLTSG